MGKIAIEAKFASVGRFEQGIAKANPDAPDLLGLVNRAGEWVVRPTWRFISFSSPRFITVQNH